MSKIHHTLSPTRTRAVFLGLVLVAGLVISPAISASAASVDASGLTATVRNSTATASVTVWPAASRTVEEAGICVRDSSGGNVDFPRSGAVWLSTAGTKLTGSANFAGGSYTYWACVKYDSTWIAAGGQKTFQVAPGYKRENLPIGDLPGWKQIFTEDFDAPVARGSFPGPYANKWVSYDGFPDTSHRGDYDQSIISAHDGVLDLNLHTENGRPLGAAPLPLVDGPGQVYGRYSVRMKSDPLPGYGLGFIMWSDAENWSDGEIDFPEGGLDDVAKGFNHCLGDHPERNCYFMPNATTDYTVWHTYTTEWRPSSIKFFIDGMLVGQTTNNIPYKPLHWVMQVATDGGPKPPESWVNGHLLINWVSIYKYAP